MAHHFGSTHGNAWSQEHTWPMNIDQETHAGSLMITNDELLDLSLEDMRLMQPISQATMPFCNPRHLSVGARNWQQVQAGAHEESDCSWTEAESQDLWFDHLQQQLTDFRQSSASTLTTVTLGSRHRRQVHSMANMWGLSHMSVGSGKQKRMLLSKCALAKTGEVKDRRWNPLRESWSPGYIDPRLVLFHWVSSTICFQTCLNVLGLPTPVNLTMDIRGDFGTVYALFQTPSDAASTLLALNGTRPHWNASTVDRNIEACYLRLPSGFSLTSHLLADGFCNLPVLVFQAFGKTHSSNPNQPPSGCMSPPMCSSQPTGTSLAPGAASPTELASALFRISSSPRQYPPLSGSALHSRRESTSRRLSLSSSLSRDLGYISASSQVDSDYSLTTNSSKKRRREPKILAGYRCTSSGCDKVFDHRGELTKHERMHTADRPHACVHCGKGFFYPKDLRRHQRTHASASTPVSPILEPVSDDLAVYENELHRPGSATHSGQGYSCGKIRGIEAVFLPRAEDEGHDSCAFCGEGFPNPPDWGIRCQHVIRVHEFGGCNQSKVFSRIDHFRQHLKHSHHSDQVCTKGLEVAASALGSIQRDVQRPDLLGLDLTQADARQRRVSALASSKTTQEHHDRARHLFGGIQTKMARFFGAAKESTSRP